MKLSNIFCYHYHDLFLWFRIFGYGLKIKDTTKHMLLFSERNGYSKGIQIGKWRVGVLKKNGI